MAAMIIFTMHPFLFPRPVFGPRVKKADFAGAAQVFGICSESDSP
jgi:hypothetical protein